MATGQTLWDYTNLSDRETLISGLLAWLLNPTADHQMGAALLHRVIQDSGAQKPAQPELVRVEAEARGKRGRRFDISIEEDGRRLLILEVKCKTHGSAKQLRTYADDEPQATVARVAFEEWNYPKLSDEDRRRFPLITFERIATLIRETQQPSAPYSDLMASFARHLEGEATALNQLQDYYVTGSRVESPVRSGSLSLSKRFVQQLFWRWFLDKQGQGFAEWNTRTQTSGVWCGGPRTDAGDSQQLVLPGLGLSLPGPLTAWIHLELRGDLFGVPDTEVARAQLRISGEASNEHRRSVLLLIRDSEDPLGQAGWRLPRRRPSVV